MFSYINIPGHLNQNNNKNKMLLIRDLYGLVEKDVFAEWNRINNIHLSQILELEKRINLLSRMLDEFDDEEQYMKANTELELIKKLFLILRGSYSDFNRFDSQRLIRLEALLNNKISEFKPEKFTVTDSNEDKKND